MFNSGTATLTGCTISGNSAKNGGGGLFNSGTATLTNCTISDNSCGDAFDKQGGGGVLNYYLSNSHDMSTLTLTGCTISGNSARYYGGGLASPVGTTAALTNCTISGNSAEGGGGLLFFLGDPHRLRDQREFRPRLRWRIVQRLHGDTD